MTSFRNKEKQKIGLSPLIISFCYMFLSSSLLFVYTLELLMLAYLDLIK